jgi:AcrR family transcriptional regulator
MSVSSATRVRLRFEYYPVTIVNSVYNLNTANYAYTVHSCQAKSFDEPEHLEMTVATTPDAGTRRERQRAATVQEIKDVARRLLVEQGTAALSLRAIAREVGVTAPALYRYFDGHEALVDTLAADFYNELCDAMERAQTEGREEHPEDVRMAVAHRLMAAATAFRTWSVDHPAEFSLIFGTPIPGVDLYDENSAACVAGQRFGLVFAALFLELWAVRPFSVPDLAELDPRLIPQLEDYRLRLGVDLPIPVVYVFLSCWARLYGLVTMEVFGHLTFALSDAEPAFMTELHQIGRLMGLTDVLDELD